MEEFSDSELIKQYLKGNEGALDILVERYFKQVFFFAKTYVKNDAEAEDIAQEVFVKAWKNLNKFEPDKKFKTWIFQITKNTCIDFLRKSKKFIAPEAIGEEQMADNLEKLTDKAPLPEAQFLAAEFSQKLDAVLSRLPKIYETVVVLHLQHDLTFQEISEVLNESINTVKSRYRRALLIIRESFGEYSAYILEINAPKSRINRIINNMEKSLLQQSQGQTALEQAVKNHLTQDSLPDFGNYLLTKILSRLNYERQLKNLKPKFWAAIGIFLAGIGLLVLAVGVSWSAFAQTPVSHYFSLMFTDFNLIMANWQDYVLSILESLPLGSLALLLSSLLGSLLLVDFSAHRFFNFRKTLNSLHYGPR